MKELYVVISYKVDIHCNVKQTVQYVFEDGKLAEEYCRRMDGVGGEHYIMRRKEIITEIEDISVYGIVEIQYDTLEEEIKTREFASGLGIQDCVYCFDRKVRFDVVGKPKESAIELQKRLEAIAKEAKNNMKGKSWEKVKAMYKRNNGKE